MGSTARAGLAAAHDAVTGAGFAVACVLTALSTCALSYEVVVRYFFNAPTEWASPAVSYSLVAGIFLAMPELTRRSAHISITTLLEILRADHAAALQKIVRIVAAAACLFAAWFSGDETLNQFRIGVSTGPPFWLPKWIISVVVPYGMLSSAIYFLRQLADGTPRAVSAGDAP